MSVQRSIVCIVATLITICSTSLPVLAAKAGVTFVPNGDPLLFNYRIHYGTLSRNYTTEIDVISPEVVDGKIMAVVDGLLEGSTYYFAATAYNAYGESDYSNEMVHDIPLPFPPVAHDINIEGVEDTPYNGLLSADNPEADSLLYQIISLPTNGTLSINEITAAFVFTPAVDFHGSDSFTYSATNIAGVSNTATANINILSVNDAPVASGASFDVDEDDSYSSQLQANDSDGDALTYQLIGSAVKGTASLNQNGSFTYTPMQGLTGNDSFSYNVSDGATESNTATVAITINSVNHAPTVHSSAFSTDQNSVYTGQLTGSDSDGDSITYSIVSTPQKGTLTVSPSGSFTYTPTTDVTGSDSFTFIATDGDLESNVGSISIVINEVTVESGYEIGEIEVTSVWQYVAFETPFTYPAVVAKAGSMNNGDPGTVRIRNITAAGFEIQFQEWDYLDGTHPAETIYYFAMEQGDYQLEENLKATAACGDISGLNSFDQVLFTAPFSEAPVVLATVVSDNEQDAATLRLKNITSTDFEVTLQEQESNDGAHSTESYCYIAMNQWSGLSNDLLFEVGTTGYTLLDTTTTVSFTQQFPEIPFVLGGMQSGNGMNTAVLGMSLVSLESVNMAIIEEQSRDTELSHIAEVGGYIAIAPFISTDDSDNDGLSNGDEYVLNTHPGLYDTDHDGLNDGQEYLYWINSLSAPDADIDGDGLINILDTDSDNDGSADGIEIQEGFDPADPLSYPVSIIMEVGEVVLTTAQTRIAFSQSYLQPVIIANAITNNDADPFVVRIHDIDSSGFTIQLQEYDYLDNIHGEETVSYLIVESGSYTLDDGTEIEAGRFNTNSTIHFTQPLMYQFANPPVVFTSILTNNENEAVLGRIRNITSTSFEYKLQEQESNAKNHATESVAYLAWSAGSGISNGIQFVAGKTSDSVTQNSYSIDLTSTFTEFPFHFAGMQTTDGGDTAAIKITEADSDHIEVRVEEEASKDSEVKHTKEVAGFLIVLPQ